MMLILEFARRSIMYTKVYKKRCNDDQRHTSDRSCSVYWTGYLADPPLQIANQWPANKQPSAGEKRSGAFCINCIYHGVAGGLVGSDLSRWDNFVCDRKAQSKYRKCFGLALFRHLANCRDRWVVCCSDAVHNCIAWAPNSAPKNPVSYPLTPNFGKALL